MSSHVTTASSASVEVSLDTGAAREGGPSVNRATAINALDSEPTPLTASAAAPTGMTLPVGAVRKPRIGAYELGRRKQGATRLGIPLTEYLRQVRNGKKWCCGHQRWCPIETFGPHCRTADGLNSKCRESDREIARARMRELYWRRKGAVS